MGDSISRPGRIWNTMMVFAPLICFFLAITIPVFLAGLGSMLLLYAAPFVIYVVQRNGKVTNDKKVFTPEHLKHWFAELGKKKAKERVLKHAWEAGPAVELVPVGPLQIENQH